MWRSGRPRFESFLLAELQRQQRCSQYCDTLLRAGGVSVPAHSCILSALCPQLSCVLSSTPPSSSGQSHLVDFQAFGACALLRLVGLLYSGEMVVEGEVEREEVMAAAAKLGISGLVEVGWSEAEEGAQSAERRATPSLTEGERWKERVREVGVQTEPLDNTGEHVAGRKSGDRDATGGNVTERHNRRQTPAGFNADAGIQTCAAIMDISLCLQSRGSEGPAEQHHQISTSYSASSTLNPGPLVSYVGDATALQEGEALPIGSMAAIGLPTHIPCIPLSLLCPVDGHQPSDISSVLTTQGGPTAATQVYVIPPSLSSSSSLLSSSIPPVHMCGHGTEAFPSGASSFPQAVDLLEGEGEDFEQFRGNIPGFISYFLNPAHFPDGERCCRRGSRRRVTGGAKRGVEEKRAPKARGRRRAGDGVGTPAAAPGEQVAAEVPQGNWLQRLWVGALRVGQGGGMVGRKVYLKTREMLQPIKILLRRKKRRGQSEVWEVSRPEVEKSQAPQRKPRRPKNQMKQDSISIIKQQVGRPRIRPLPFPSLPKYLFEALTYEPPPSPPASTPPTAAFPSPTPAQAPNAASPVPFKAPAPALLHTAPLPPLVSSPQEHSSEQFEFLLQDIMMDLDLMPSVAVATQSNNIPQENAATAPPPAAPPPAAPPPAAPPPAAPPPAAPPPAAPLPAAPHRHSNRDHFSKSFNQPSTLSALSTGYHGDMNAITPTAYPVVEATGYGGTTMAESEGPLLQQQQAEGNLSDILDHFLLSFEQQVACSANSMLKGNIQTDCSNTDRAPDLYAAMKNYVSPDRAQIQTGPAEHRAQTSSVLEVMHAVTSPHSAKHTAHQQHTHTLYGAESDPVRHYSLIHTTPKPSSSATLSPAKTAPTTGQPSHIGMEEKLVGEGRRMRRSQIREGIRTSEVRGVKRFPPALEQTQRQHSEEQSTKTHPSQSQPSKPSPSQSQPAKPPFSQSQPTKAPPTQFNKLINRKPTVQAKPLLPRGQLKSICNRKYDRDETRHLVRKIKQSQSVCSTGQQLENYATGCMVKLDDTLLLAGTSGKRPHPAKQPIKVPEKVSVQTVLPIREIGFEIEDLRVGGSKERKRLIRRLADRCPSAPPPGTAKNRRQNRGEKRLRLESETNEPKRRKEEEGEEDMGEERDTTCPGHPEPVKSNPVSQRYLSSPKLQLEAQRHPSPAQNRDESGKKEPTTVELDEEVDVIHVTTATKFEEVREVLCSQSGGADIEGSWGKPEGGEGKEREEKNWAAFRHQESPSTEEDIDVVELDSAGSVDVVGEGDGEQVEAGGGAGQQRRLGVEWKPGLLHCGIDQTSDSVFTQEHSKRSTGSWEEEEEVDVVGDYSSVPLVALPGNLGEGLFCEDEDEEEEEDGEEEIDVTR